MQNACTPKFVMFLSTPSKYGAICGSKKYDFFHEPRFR